MAEDLMRYDQLAQSALRNGVVREALRRVATDGLPGEHHFYITFNTSFPGVEMSDRMREKYPREMTIVLQHQFDDLHVHDDSFEVKLSFDQIPERLRVPLEALKAFFDPAVPFGLQFEVVQAQPASSSERSNGRLAQVKAMPPRDAAEKPADTPADAASLEEPKVISLDSFRKK